MDAARTIVTDAPEAAPEGVTRVTPMMEQYIEIKAANPDLSLIHI